MRFSRSGALALVGGVLAPVAALAQEGGGAGSPGGLAAHFNTLLISFFVLLGLFVVLLLWEFMAGRAGAAAPATASGSPYQTPTTGAAEEAPAEEDDPFRSLLHKSAASSREEPMATPFRPDSVEEAPPPAPSAYVEAPAPPPPARPVQEEEDEELSPFQRLAQIGSEEGSEFSAPAPQPARPQRIDLGRGVTPAPAAPQSAAEESGGDWAALLSKVQSDEPPVSAPAAAPPPAAPTPAVPPPAGPPAEDDDPWRKLLGQSAGAPETPAGGDEEADPWQALLQKTSSEDRPAATPASGHPEPAAGSGRIKLDLNSTAPPPSGEAPAAPEANSEESTRPRAISLDLKRDAGKPTPPPPPETEDE